jgi:hypothetical protein
MGEASTARAYRSSGAGNSPFSLPDLVRASTWPPTYRELLLAMLKKNRFGTELWRSTRNLAIDLGVSYSTVKRMIDRLEKGHSFGKKRIVRCEPVLEIVLEANSRPNGTLRRQRTYRISDARRICRRPTPEEVEGSSRGAVCVLPSRPMPPAHAPSVPARPAEHRGTARPQTTKIARGEIAKIVAEILRLQKGYTHHVEAVGGYGFNLTPSDPRYRAPMSLRDAIIAACEAFKRSPDLVLEAIKFWGYNLGDPEGP